MCEAMLALAVIPRATACGRTHLVRDAGRLIAALQKGNDPEVGGPRCRHRNLSKDGRHTRLHRGLSYQPGHVAVACTGRRLGSGQWHGYR
jgi:hypothetical protein